MRVIRGAPKRVVLPGTGPVSRNAPLDRETHEAVVVLGDEPVHAAFEQNAENWVEGVVRLAEVHTRAAVTQVLEAMPAGRLRPQWLSDGLVLRVLVRPHLGHALPRPAHAPREQPPRHRERAATHEAFAPAVALVHDLDADPAVLDDAVLAGRPRRRRRVEGAPHLLGRGLDLEREFVALQLRLH